jgi:hypothetical protein
MLWKYPAWVIGSFLILMIFCNHVLLSFSTNSIAMTSKEQLDSLQKLRSFALSKINEDRKHYGLTSLVMSNNTAAQIHADQILKTKTLSHLSIEGFKPYMLYSLYNGTGYVQQNVGQISYVMPDNDKKFRQVSDLCYDHTKFYCPVIDKYKAIADLQHSMMYNDLQCCNDGHKNNILNKYHTHVSIGIAYNEYYFVMVQNFENHYLSPDLKIKKSNDDIKLEARINDPDRYNFVINHVSFFLDEFPTKLNYDENKNVSSYRFGDLKLMVSKPLPANLKYVQEGDDNSYKIIEAKKWELDKDDINLEIEIPDTLDTKNKVLTMVIYAQSIGDNSLNEISQDYIPLTSYSFFNS